MTEDQRRRKATIEFRLKIARMIVARGPKDHRFAEASADIPRLEAALKEI